MKPINLKNEETPVMQKTRELCQTILEQPGYQELKQSVVTFLADPAAREQYDKLCDMQDALHAKSHAGEEVTSEDMAGFEQLEEAFMGNPLARDFIRAQQQMQQIEKSIGDYVRKTFELGRLPEDDDFESAGGCGSGSCGSGGCGSGSCGSH